MMFLYFCTKKSSLFTQTKNCCVFCGIVAFFSITEDKGSAGREVIFTEEDHQGELLVRGSELDCPVLRSGAVLCLHHIM